MSAEGTIKYSLQGPFGRSLDSIRASLHNHGMRIVGEVDISSRLEQSLHLVLSPCRIVFTLPDQAVWGAHTVHPWAAVFLPLHIVIWGTDRQSEIGITNMLQIEPNGRDAKPFGVIVEAQRRLLQAIEEVAVRHSVLG